MLTYPEALALIADLQVATRRETLPLPDAAGRLLASDVTIDRDQPSFDRSTMDGYAIALDGDRDHFTVLATVTAGEHFDGTLEPGQAVRIMTGAPCPPGVSVVPIELTDGGDTEVHITEPSALKPRRNIAVRGEDAHAGDVLVAAGTRLGPQVLSAVAMAGASEVDTWAPPRVGVVTTGDEVGQGGPAGIRDSNGPLLQSFLAAAGCPVSRTHAKDDPDELRAALAAAADASDIVVTVGGVSMGSKDLVPGTALALGFEQILHKVAVQPGKPIFIARHPGGKLFVGLPGNPVSVLATAHLFLAPALGRFQGGWTPRWLELPLAVPHHHRGRRHLFLPATLDDGGVHPVRWNGSGDLIAAATADGLIDLPVGSNLDAGARVRFLPFLGHVAGERAQLPPRAPRS